MKVEIILIRTAKEIAQFIDFPHDLYADDPNYVPELRMVVKEMLNPKKNPFFEHSSADLFLAIREGQVAGRIAAIRNNNYNAFHRANVGFFGFFDVVDDYQVAKALLDTVYAWNNHQGFTTILGPTNFTTNDTAGVLIRGFDQPPVVQMTYNKAYYADFLERYGYAKEMDLYAYFIPTKTANDKCIRLTEALEKRLLRKGITFRTVDLKNFKQEAAAIKEVYADAWEQNWGFVPPTSHEFDHLADGLKMILDARFNFIAEQNGKMIGFAVGVPNINEILIKTKRGRLYPWDIFRLLLGKKKVKIVRVILLGVIAPYRNLGVEAVFFAKYIQEAYKNGLLGGEASWVLENNHMMRKAAEHLNGEIYKTYRMYKLPIH